MMVFRGEIWLANLNPQKKANEIGKTRPVVIIQNNILNQDNYPTVVVLPLTTVLIDDAEPLRMRIKKRELLNADSDVLIAHIRTIDKERLIERLSSVSEKEMKKMQNLFKEVVF